MTKQHIQVKLRKGTTEMVAWIPRDCAIEGKLVDLDDPEHGPTKGWTVINVTTTALDSKWVNERSRDYLNHRKTTDI
jgi:hypothetical protein